MRQILDSFLIEIRTTQASQQATIDDILRRIDARHTVITDQKKINQDLREQNELIVNWISSLEHDFVKRTARPVIQGILLSIFIRHI